MLIERLFKNPLPLTCTSISPHLAVMQHVSSAPNLTKVQSSMPDSGTKQTSESYR